MNSIVGTWTPKDLVLPNVPSNVDYAQYYITDSGQIDGLDIEFKQGYWLVYIKNDQGQHWYQSAGVTAANVKRPEFYPDPGFYTKVRLDNQGNIIGAEDLIAEDLPDHHHTAHDIVGIESIVATQLSKGIANNMQNAVEFKFDKKTNGLSADVRIDDNTIIKNSYGELAVNPDLMATLGGGEDGTGHGCANHEHSIDQIDGFEDAVVEVINKNGLLDVAAQNIEDLVDGTTIVINSNGQLASVASGGNFKDHQHEIKDIVDLDPERLEWAASQLISNNTDIDLKEGIEDFSNATIGDFIQYVNNYLKSVKENVDDLLAHKGKVEPAMPRPISKLTPVDVATKTQVYDALLNFKVVEASTMLSVTIDKVCPKEGRIQIFDGDKIIGDYDTSLNTNQQYFTVTFDGDFYEDDPNYSGFYKAISLKYDNANLKEGKHTIYFKHKYGDVEEISQPLFVNIYEKDRKFKLDSVKIDVDNDKYVSGIPCYEVDKRFVVTPIIKNVERFVSLNCITFNKAEQKPIAYSALKKEVSFESCIQVYAGYTGVTEITYNCTQPNGVKESLTTKSNMLRYDWTWVESYRVKTTVRDPRTEGKISISEFDSTLPFVSAQCEAPIINNVAYNNSINYKEFKGPDYSKLKVGRLNFAFDRNPSYSGNYKFVTLRFTNVPIGMRSIKIDLVDENDNPFATTECGEFDKVALFASVGTNDKTNGLVLVGNKYWNGRDSVANNNFPALDLYRSTDVTKVLTFGKNPPTYGEDNNCLYLIIGVQTSLNIARVIKSVEESINDWR